MKRSNNPEDLLRPEEFPLGSPESRAAARVELERRAAEEKAIIAYNRILTFFPDNGPHRRELYPKHLEFFRAGREHRERCFLAGNRTGKTTMAAYEVTLHLTGRYPGWWEGRRFDHPISAWGAGDSGKTTRDIIQRALLGPPGAEGTAMIPRDSLLEWTPKPGVPEAVETIRVRHVSGERSEITLKSYDQGRESFQGTNKDLVWFDEEVELDVYTEGLMRTMTTGGLVIVTFTPMRGLTQLVKDFLQPALRSEAGPEPVPQSPDPGPKFVVTATWEDVPHLSDREKTELLASIPPYQRDARSKGVPQLGSGAIFPVPESDFVVDDFELPAHYQHAFAMDVGWRKTAAVWFARDPATGVIFAYAEHYRGQAEPSVHAHGIHSRGAWIPGVIDPAANGRSQIDGRRLLEIYRGLGLNVEPADNSVEAGLCATWQLLSSGRLKVFRSLQNWLTEFRTFQRDEQGRIVDESSYHLMACTRYFVMSGRDRMKAKLGPPKVKAELVYSFPDRALRWMGS